MCQMAHWHIYAMELVSVKLCIEGEGLLLMPGGYQTKLVDVFGPCHIFFSLLITICNSIQTG